MHGIIPRWPTFYQDPTLGKLPALFGRAEAVDGDAEPWISCPVGSIYVRYDDSNVGLYVKTADNSADADWDVATLT